MTSRRLTLLVLLVAVFFLLPSGVQFYGDWLWFGEVGYQGVYARSLATQSTLWLSTFVDRLRRPDAQPAAGVPRADAA